MADNIMDEPPMLAFAISTFNRPQAVVRLVHSIRDKFGTVPIYVADQSEPDPGLESFCESLDVNYIDLPFDCGVSHARNVMVNAVTEPYFVLCDDDFIMRADSDFDGALAILQSDPNIGVVGGRLWDHHDGKPHHRTWELVMQYDRRNRMLLNIPIQNLRPREAHLGARRYFYCDAVMNFAVMRRSMFANGVGWDPRYTCNGEHEDFYLNLKENTQYQVVYLPEMVADHDHVEGVGYARLRHRSVGWHLFFEKWDLDQLWEAGMGFRCRARPDDWVSADRAKAQFLHTNDGHPLTPGQKSLGSVTLSSKGSLCPSDIYGPFGDPAHSGEPETAAMIIGGEGEIVAIPVSERLELNDVDPAPVLALDLSKVTTTVYHREAVVAGGSTAVWLHVEPLDQRVPLPGSFSLTLHARWRAGRSYTSWGKAPLVLGRTVGPGEGAWLSAIVHVPPHLGTRAEANVLELWPDGSLAPPVVTCQPVVVPAQGTVASGSLVPAISAGVKGDGAREMPISTELLPKTVFRPVEQGAAA